MEWQGQIFSSSNSDDEALDEIIVDNIKYVYIDEIIIRTIIYPCMQPFLVNNIQ